MLQFICQYWLQWLFGAIIAVAALFGKKFWSLYITQRRQAISKQCEDVVSKLEKSLANSIEILTEENKRQNDEIKVVRAGVLSLYSLSFKNYCHQLLEEEHELTIEEVENCSEEYGVYRSLGGNGQGTMLYELVLKKAEDLNHQTKKREP